MTEEGQRREIALDELLVEKRDEEFFEQLGKRTSSLSEFSNTFRAKKTSYEKNKQELLQLEEDEGVIHVNDDCDDYESEEEIEKVKGLNLRPVASWVKSMQYFELRKHSAEQWVQQGLVQARHTTKKVVPIQFEADLDLYSLEEQRKRWKAGQSQRFQSLVRQLWQLVMNTSSLKEEEKLDKESYIELVFRFHYICCPPPLDPDAVYASTLNDWQNDSKGKDSIEYNDFFRAIFQCVDLWTETSQLDEYLGLLRRLIAGTCIAKAKPSKSSSSSSEEGEQDDDLGLVALRRKSDLYFDDFFDIVSDSGRFPLSYNRRSTKQKKILSENENKATRRRSSLVTPRQIADAPEPKSKKRRASCTGRSPVLSADQTNALIAKCYQAKMQADAAELRAKSRGKPFEKSIRFDYFVVRFFKRSHGTVGIARRHLRIFVHSIEAMLNDDSTLDNTLATSQQPRRLSRYPRAALFAEVAGITGASSHNARLMPHFLLPILRTLYPDLNNAASLMLRQQPMPLSQMLEVLKSAVPATLQHSSVLSVLEKAIEPATSSGGGVCPDQAIWLAWPILCKFDILQAFRRNRSANVAQAYARRWLKKRLGIRAQAKNVACTPRQKLEAAQGLDAQIVVSLSSSSKHLTDEK